MPRRKTGPRLYLDPKRRQWVIRDGPHFVRTGCVEADTGGAEKALRWYLSRKHEPQRASDPALADILLVYLREHIPHTSRPKDGGYYIASIEAWWGDKKLSDVTAANCRAYAGTKRGARRDLEVLRAAINYWHRNYGPLPVVPVVALPAKAPPRERWLTREEAKRLRKAAMQWPHLYRFVVLGLLTGSRSGVILSLRWDQLDLDRGIMYRRAAGKAEDARKRTPPVKLSRRLIRLLRRWKRQDRGIPQVVHYGGSQVKRIKRTWALACEKAGLAGVSPHTLRHTRAAWLVQEGVDLWEAAGHLGMTVQTLQAVYGKHSADWQKRASEV